MLPMQREVRKKKRTSIEKIEQLMAQYRLLVVIPKDGYHCPLVYLPSRAIDLARLETMQRSRS